jgi:DNA-binding MarR family transcriptional regulator
VTGTVEASGTLDSTDLVDAIRALVRATDAFRFRQGARAGLSLAETTTLVELLRRQPLRAKQIQEVTGLTQGSITPLLDRLDARGLTQRSRPSHDKRTVAVTLTPDGERVAAELVGPLGELVREALVRPGLPAPEVMVGFLHHLAAVLRDHAG